MKVYTIADDMSAIGKLTPEQKAARKKKRKAGAKKFLWGVAFIHLAPIRGAFTAIVAANFNAFANNLGFLYDNRNGKTKEAWNKIKSIWKKVGGIEKALIKAINLGRKHKPLFLSKKVKARFEKRKKEQGIKGIYIGSEAVGEEIGVAPAVIAAAITAATGIIGAIIPVMMKGLKKGGQEQAAQEVAQQGEELVQQVREPQFAAQAEQAAEQQLPDQSENESVEGIYGEDWGQLTEALTRVAQVGITAAGNAIAKKVKKKPKAAAALEKLGEGADDYFTGRYLRQSGLKDRAKQFQSIFRGNMPLYLGLGAAAVVGGILLITKK